MTQHTWSLRWLISGIYFIIIVVCVGVLAWYFAYRADENSRYLLRESLQRQTVLCAETLSRVQTREGIEAILRRWYTTAGTEQFPTRQILLVAPDGRVIVGLPEDAVPPAVTITPDIAQALGTNGLGVREQWDPATDHTIVHVAARVDPPPQGADHPGTLGPPSVIVLSAVITAPLSRHALLTENAALGIAVLLGILVIINLGVSNYITRPLADLRDAAMRIAKGDLHERTIPTGAAEIASLSQSFNAMAQQLRQTINGLAKERAQAEAMLASMTNGIIVADTAGHVVMMNHSAEMICGVQAAQVIGRTLNEATMQYELQDMLVKALELDLPIKQEMTFLHPVERHVEVSLAPVTVDHHHTAVVIVLYDVTQQRQMEHIHREFVANVSHELRTPVASIRAMAETMLDMDGDSPELAREFLHSTITQSERLTALLDDLLQLARMDAKEHQLAPTPTDLCEVVRDVVDHMTPLIQGKHQTLTLEMPDQVMVLAERDMLVQVLVNLLDNARKYSPEGASITVRIDPAEDQVVLSVRDTGYGIPRQAIPRLFERFFRVDRGRGRSEGGTGLGLAIVKQLVEQYGGNVSVESEIEVGSCFAVTLPCSTSVARTPEEAGELPPYAS